MTRLPQETRPLNGGEQKRYRFPNDFGASVIRSDFSYGGDHGLWELAVLDWANGGGLCYDTSITSDVIGHLTEAEVEEILDRIEALPRRW